MEIGNQKNFTSNQIEIIKDHIEIVNEQDEFIVWLGGAIDVAIVFGRQRSQRFYDAVKTRLDSFFSKKTPERDREIKEACDEVVGENERYKNFDERKIEEFIRDIEKGLPPQRVITPLVVGPVPITCSPPVGDIVKSLRSSEGDKCT